MASVHQDDDRRSHLDAFIGSFDLLVRLTKFLRFLFSLILLLAHRSLRLFRNLGLPGEVNLIED